jgi:ABC-type Fe3+ transport system permease subunit
MSDMEQRTTQDIIAERHPFIEAWQMFRRNHAAMVALVVLSLIVFGAIFGPLVYPIDPFEMVWTPFSPPGVDGFILGTDYLGRDLLSAIIHGARVSILIGLSAAFMSVFIGVSVGAIAGFYRGWVEEVLMRITEFFSGSSHITLFNGYSCTLWFFPNDDNVFNRNRQLDRSCQNNSFRISADPRTRICYGKPRLRFDGRQAYFQSDPP